MLNDILGMVKIKSKYILCTFLVILGIIAISCTNKPTCNEPYILVGTDCCLDKNDNKICDKDEGDLPSTTGYTTKEKENCPFECCTSSEYKIKECAQDFECKSTKCVAIDSDGDGLTDTEEKQIGTEIRLADTDSDGLNDYQEVKSYGTNPRNSNTDADRYVDGDEIKLNKNPSIKNLPKINSYKLNERGEYNLANIIVVGGAISVAYGIITSTASLSAPIVIGILDKLKLTEKEVYKSSVDVYFENIGDDYTDWITYKINFYVDGKLIDSKQDLIGRLNENSKSSLKHYSVSLTALQTAGQILSIINKKAIVEVKIEDLGYESP